MAGLMFGKEKAESLEELREVCAAPEKAHEYLQELFAAYGEGRLDFFLRNNGAVETADKIKALNSKDFDFPAQFREALGLRNSLEEVVNALRPPPDEPAFEERPAETQEQQDEKTPNPETKPHPDSATPISASQEPAKVLDKYKIEKVWRVPPKPVIIADKRDMGFRDISVFVGINIIRVTADKKKSKVSLFVNGKLIEEKMMHGEHPISTTIRTIVEPVRIDVYVRQSHRVKLCINETFAAGDFM